MIHLDFDNTCKIRNNKMKLLVKRLRFKSYSISTIYFLKKKEGCRFATSSHLRLLTYIFPNFIISIRKSKYLMLNAYGLSLMFVVSIFFSIINIKN